MGWKNYWRENGKDRPITPVSVWWDIENVNIEVFLSTNLKDAHCLKPRLEDFLKERFPERAFKVERITGTGNLACLRKNCKEQLSEAGIILEMVTSRKESAADLAIVEGFMSFVFHNKPPHMVILASGDRYIEVVQLNL